jgi:Family of unknown function (DUF5677)
MEEYHACLLSLISLCEKLCSRMQERVKVEGPHRITLGFFSKATRTLKAIGLLYENNLNEEAQSLVRIIFETHIYFFMFLLMMREDPESTFYRVGDSMILEKVKQQRESKFVGLDLLPEKLTPEEMLQAEEEIKSRYSEEAFKKLKKYGFAGMNLEQCAIKTENKETYDIFYRNFSRNIHATDYMEFFLRQNIELTPTGPLYLEIRNQVSYQIAINSLAPMADAINGLFRLGMSKELDKHLSKWVQCLGRARAGKKRTRQAQQSNHRRGRG